MYVLYLLSYMLMVCLNVDDLWVDLFRSAVTMDVIVLLNFTLIVPSGIVIKPCWLARDAL